jgi:hypothetical protein
VPVAYVALTIVLVAGQVEASPFFSMHRTALARWFDADGARFPEASYDYGVREAVSRIAASASADADVISDVPQVVRFYLDRAPRADLRVRKLSSTGVFGNATEQWLLVQDSHVYFETQASIALLRMRHKPAAEYKIGDVTVLQVYRIAKGRF